MARDNIFKMAAMFEIGSEPFEQSLVPPWVGTYMPKDSLIDPAVSEEKMLTDADDDDAG